MTQSTPVHTQSTPKNANQNEKLTYTVSELASMLQISKSTMYSFLKTHPEIATLTIGKSGIRVVKKSFDLFLSNCEQSGAYEETCQGG